MSHEAFFAIPPFRNFDPVGVLAFLASAQERGKTPSTAAPSTVTASFYGNRMNGHKTATGERFNNKHLPRLTKHIRSAHDCASRMYGIKEAWLCESMIAAHS